MSTLTPHLAPHAARRLGASTPIADYGLLADCNSSALVDRSGSIDWLCLPRYDGDAIFARLLDPGAGHWSIRPAGAFTVQRRYVPGTLVIETTLMTDTGSVRLCDAMAFAERRTRRTASSVRTTTAGPATGRRRARAGKTRPTDTSSRRRPSHGCARRSPGCHWSSASSSPCATLTAGRAGNCVTR
jgi:hypothetical protein